MPRVSSSSARLKSRGLGTSPSSVNRSSVNSPSCILLCCLIIRQVAKNLQLCWVTAPESATLKWKARSLFTETAQPFPAGLGTG